MNTISGFLTCNGEGVLDFKYVEGVNNDTVEIASFNVTLSGSYASLGDWPHWCLGNLSRCTNGLTVELWVQFTEIAEDASDVIVFSTGGHTWYSNGVYLLQVCLSIQLCFF